MRNSQTDLFATVGHGDLPRILPPLCFACNVPMRFARIDLSIPASASGLHLQERTEYEVFRCPRCQTTLRKLFYGEET